MTRAVIAMRCSELLGRLDRIVATGQVEDPALLGALVRLGAALENLRSVAAGFSIPTLEQLASAEEMLEVYQREIERLAPPLLN